MKPLEWSENKCFMITWRVMAGFNQRWDFYHCWWDNFPPPPPSPLAPFKDAPSALGLVSIWFTSPSHAPMMHGSSGPTPLLPTVHANVERN